MYSPVALFSSPQYLTTLGRGYNPQCFVFGWFKKEMFSWKLYIDLRREDNNLNWDECDA